MSRQAQSKDRQYLLQNSNINQDNLVFFWGKNAEGYTSDLSKAHLFNYEEVMAQHAKRTSDIPHHVDAMQSIGANVVDRDALLRLQREGTPSLYAPKIKAVNTGISESYAVEAIRQRDMLSKAIHDAAVAAGICSGGQSLTGPQLLMLADDLGAAAAETVKRNEYSLKHIQAESLMTRLTRTNAAIQHSNGAEPAVYPMSSEIPDDLLKQKKTAIGNASAEYSLILATQLDPGTRRPFNEGEKVFIQGELEKNQQQPGDSDLDDDPDYGPGMS
jgi:hypothetical protein